MPTDLTQVMAASGDVLPSRTRWCHGRYPALWDVWEEVDGMYDEMRVRVGVSGCLHRHRMRGESPSPEIRSREFRPLPAAGRDGPSQPTERFKQESCRDRCGTVHARGMLMGRTSRACAASLIAALAAPKHW